MILMRSGNMFLYSYDMGWMDYGDDPSCWTDDPAKAMDFSNITVERSRQLLRAVSHWHEEPHWEVWHEGSRVG